MVARSLGRMRSSSSNFPEARYRSSLDREVMEALQRIIALLSGENLLFQKKGQLLKNIKRRKYYFQIDTHIFFEIISMQEIEN